MKTINASLSDNSIMNAIRQLQLYKRDVLQKTQQLIQVLTDTGIEIARANVIEMGAFYSGELASSIQGYYSPALGAGIIFAGADYAAFVEFGTGITGMGAPHPDPQGWRYDINGHGEHGWWYYKNGEWHWTKGMPSRPFMYETAKELERAVYSIARSILT